MLEMANDEQRTSCQDFSGHVTDFITLSQQKQQKIKRVPHFS